MANSDESTKHNPEFSKKQDKIEGGGVETERETESDSVMGQDGELEKMSEDESDSVKGQANEAEKMSETESDAVKGKVDKGKKVMTEADNDDGGVSSAFPLSPMSAVAMKRGWTMAVGSCTGEVSGSTVKKRGEMEEPSGEPICYVCKKSFGSWPALFGHMRFHGRDTPGAFPPPVFTPPEGSPERNNNVDKEVLKEVLAPTLLNLARETLLKMNRGENIAEDASSSRSQPGPAKGLGVDLNVPRTRVPLNFDLNAPPPPEQLTYEDYYFSSDDESDDSDDDDDDGADADDN